MDELKNGNKCKNGINFYYGLFAAQKKIPTVIVGIDSVRDPYGTNLEPLAMGLEAVNFLK